MERRRQSQPGQRAENRAIARAAAPAYKIYYLPGFLAGQFSTWPRHFERIAGLGLKQVCLAPIGTPSRSGDIFLADDVDQSDRRLGGPQSTQRLLADVCRIAEAHGLEIFIDAVLDRAAADGAAVRARPELFLEPAAT